MIVLGLTGSVGMGKTTVAGFFAAENIPVYSADEAAHSLYAQADIAAELERAFPGCKAASADGRQKLAQRLNAGKTAAARAANWARLEALIHPHIRAREQAFVRAAAAQGQPLIVLDIPLLLEGIEKERRGTGGKKPAAKRADYIAVVSAPYAQQEKRVLARDNMNAAKFAAILARQMPDAEKRARADFIIDTGQSLAATRAAVHALIIKLKAAAAEHGPRAEHKEKERQSHA